MASKMAFSSIFRRVNVKELISNASVYASATGNSIYAVGVTCTFYFLLKIIIPACDMLDSRIFWRNELGV